MNRNTRKMYTLVFVIKPLTELRVLCLFRKSKDSPVSFTSLLEYYVWTIIWVMNHLGSYLGYESTQILTHV